MIDQTGKDNSETLRIESELELTIFKDHKARKSGTFHFCDESLSLSKQTS